MIGRVHPDFWSGKKVFLTGHTGFKGGWLAYWLTELGAKVVGYSLEPNTTPSFFDVIRLHELVESVIGDIRDVERLTNVLFAAKPDIVMHLAAQPIVSTGYEDPVSTFDTNIMGVVHIMEACRKLESLGAILVISSDKCYENVGNGVAFKVGDPLGGYDPYSASKAGTELVVNSYRTSFFEQTGVAVASARAGNVVGGGDWSLDRLLPDGARAFASGKPLVIRNPSSTRPWQHVIEPLYGYLALAEAMISEKSFSRPWNFGPSDRDHYPVGLLAQRFADAWGEGARVKLSGKPIWKEAHTLSLDCKETNHLLNWYPVLDINSTIHWSSEWYKSYYSGWSAGDMRNLTSNQIKKYKEKI